MDWQYIPDLPLQHIFAYLNKRDRFHASLSCKRWLEAFFNPQLWRTFTFNWKHEENMRKLWYDIAMYHLFRQFKVVGRHFRRIIVPPTVDYYALHGFLQHWGRCLQRYSMTGQPIPVHTFHFTFASEIIGGQIFGTGGRLLDALKEVLSRHEFLRNLVLDNLLLDVTDALTLLEDVLLICGLRLHRLSAVSVCKQPAGFYAAAMFPNLQLLRLNPLQLNGDLLEALLNETQLMRLVLRQNCFTMWPEADSIPFVPPSPEQWRRASRKAPFFRVTFEVTGLSCCPGQPGARCPLMWPARFAPIDGVFFACSGVDLTSDMVNILADYADTLAAFGFCVFPEEEEMASDDFIMGEDVRAWADLASFCPHLQTVLLSGPTTTWFLMLLTAAVPHLLHLIVRRSQVIGAPFPSNEVTSLWRGISEEALASTRQCCASVNRTEHELAFILKQPAWRYLSDADFKRSNPVNELDFLSDH